MVKTARERRSRLLALLGCMTVVATFVAYAAMLQQQANVDEGRAVGLFGNLQGAPTWVLAALALAAALDAVATVLQCGRRRRLLLAVAATVLTGLGLLAIFSIGLPLLLAAGMTVGAATSDVGNADHRNPAAGPSTSGHHRRTA